jgi:hypothetical protein
MTINYKTALGNMRQRRLGDDAISFDYATSALKSESYESRGKSDASRYTLGAMQEVDPNYTRISIEEGDRVKSHLNSSLTTRLVFRYQGSVPLNTHIRRGSDIDLLVIHDDFFVYDETGPKAQSYTGGFDGLASMIKLRKDCEESLKSRYHAATVDISGAKSIALSGGSFKRKIDVVPANWYDTYKYQQYNQEYFRDIQVLDKTVPESVKNSPFMFMHEINMKDLRVDGGAKKVIRMLKNVKNDSSYNIKLSTYDITSLVWHMSDELLTVKPYMELSLLANTQDYLNYLYHRESHAKALMTPDNSRRILNEPAKWDGLQRLSYEIDALSKSVYEEIVPFPSDSSFDTVRKRLLMEAV